MKKKKRVFCDTSFVVLSFRSRKIIDIIRGWKGNDKEIEGINYERDYKFYNASPISCYRLYLLFLFRLCVTLVNVIFWDLRVKDNMFLLFMFYVFSSIPYTYLENYNEFMLMSTIK